MNFEVVYIAFHMHQHATSKNDVVSLVILLDVLLRSVLWIQGRYPWHWHNFCLEFAVVSAVEWHHHNHNGLCLEANPVVLHAIEKVCRGMGLS